MSEIWYILKVGLITFFVVLAMQIEIGHNTIENHATLFIRQSSALDPIRNIAEGGVVALKDSYRIASKEVDSFVAKHFINDKNENSEDLE